MPTTIVKETTVYTLEELEALSWTVYEKALLSVKEWSYDGWEPQWYSDDVRSFVKEEYLLFDMEDSSLEWSTNPNWIRGKGSIDLRDYMRNQKLHTKYRALWYAVDTLRLESCVSVSFGWGETTDLSNLERSIDYDIEGLKYESPRYNKLMTQIEELRKDIDNYTEGIEDRLLNNLRAEIDYLWSDENAKETIENNEMVFTEDGDIYHG